MKTSNTNFTTLLAELTTGILLVVGISLVISSTTMNVLAQVSMQRLYGDVTATAPGSLLTETLHGAAMPLLVQEQEMTSLLLIGMFLVLVAYLFYAIYVMNKRIRETESRSLWHKITTWFQNNLDHQPTHRLRLMAR